MLYIAIMAHTPSLTRIAAEINTHRFPNMMADVTPTSIKERIKSRIMQYPNEVWLIINTQTTARWSDKDGRVIFI